MSDQNLGTICMVQIVWSICIKFCSADYRFTASSLFLVGQSECAEMLDVPNVCFCIKEYPVLLPSLVIDVRSAYRTTACHGTKQNRIEGGYVNDVVGNATGSADVSYCDK